MAIWIQALSWALIYAVGQGLLVHATLWLLLKMMPNIPANTKYHLSLSALTVLLGWFVVTLWQQYEAAALVNERMILLGRYDIEAVRQSLMMNTAIDHSKPFLSSFIAIFPWLSVCYVAGLLFMLLRLSAGMRQLFSLKDKGVSQAGAAMNELLQALKERMYFYGKVELLISLKAQVPMVIGFFKPVILLPASAVTQLDAEQLEAILLHELAHIKRYDYLVNILQTVVETILFFNPFVWMISSIVRREREHSCDDLVLEHTREPLSYATALATIAEQQEGVTSLVIAASGQSNHLFNRIKRIMEMKKNSFSYSRMVAAILIVTAISCSVAWLTPSFAESKDVKPVKAADTKQQPVINNTDAGNAEEGQLVKMLSNDGLVNEFKGFTVEKDYGKLYINGKLQADEVAARYLPKLKKDKMRVEVFPFEQRVQMHPGSSIIQLLAPTTMQSGCVEYGPKGKDGC